MPGGGGSEGSDVEGVAAGGEEVEPRVCALGAALRQLWWGSARLRPVRCGACVGRHLGVVLDRRATRAMAEEGGTRRPRFFY